MFILGGRLNDVWSSSDGGINWDLVTNSAAWSTRSGHTSVVSDSKIYVLGGSGSIIKNDVWSSSD